MIRIKSVILLFSALSILIFSCNLREQNQVPGEWPDSIPSVRALVETDSMPQLTGEDAADDPAIWYNRQNPDSSLVFGTDKKGGIAVFNLHGKMVAYHPVGLPNNADLRYNFPLGTDTIDILGFSNRTANTVDIYRIYPDGNLENLLNTPIKPGFSAEVYGFCFYRNLKSNDFYALVNSKNGEVEQYRLNGAGGSVTTELLRTLKLPGQPEGMVADDELDLLYLGEEDAGIWKCEASPESKALPVLLPSSDLKNNPNLKADIEGLAIYYAAGGGYLIASSQGNYSYAVFDRQGTNEYLGSFRVTDGTLDGAEETDGLEVINLPMDSRFPAGMLVVQDGFNKDSTGIDLPQNFKYIDWRDIAGSFKPALVTDTVHYPLLK
jgi:3-phytase